MVSFPFFPINFSNLILKVFSDDQEKVQTIAIALDYATDASLLAKYPYNSFLTSII